MQKHILMLLRCVKLKKRKCSFVSHFSGGIRKWQRGSGFGARRKMFYLVMWEGWKVGEGYMRHRRKWESLCECVRLCVREREEHQTCPSPPSLTVHVWRAAQRKSNDKHVCHCWGNNPSHGGGFPATGGSNAAWPATASTVKYLYLINIWRY